jgi:aminoglycoside phosphotransferase (APT) family kinase protein
MRFRPNGLPFAIYRRIPGVHLLDLTRRPSPTFGRDLGRFLRALRSFPVQEALSLGLEFVDGNLARRSRIDQYEKFVRLAFPLLGCETRQYAATIIEARINDPAEYTFEPRLTHADIDDRNVLADPITGELTGVIDFGDANVGPVVGDFTWAYCGGFERLSIANQIPDLLSEGGIEESALDGRREFIEIWWPLHDILHGLDIGDEQDIADAITLLNARTPRELRC